MLSARQLDALIRAWLVSGVVLWIAIIVLAVVMVIGVVPAHAGESETWVTGWCCSRHWPAGEHRERNFGAGLDYTLANRDAVIAGNYRNSHDRTSSYIAYGLRTWSADAVGLAFEGRVLFGTVSGYGSNERARQMLRPLILPSFTVRGRRVGAVVMGVPGLLLGLGLEVRLP